MHRLRKALNITRRYSRYGYPAVFRGVYRVLSCVSTLTNPSLQLPTHLLGQLVHLLGRQPCISKHADLDRVRPCLNARVEGSYYLRRDVAPIVTATQVFEVRFQ